MIYALQMLILIKLLW